MNLLMPSSIDAGLIQALIVVVIFGFGCIVTWLVWLSLRHFKYGKPAYEYLAGNDDLSEDGHISKSDDRFDELDAAHSQLEERVEMVAENVRKVDQTQDTVLSNQKKIADGIGVDLDKPRFYRGGVGRDDDRSIGDADPTDD